MHTHIRALSFIVGNKKGVEHGHICWPSGEISVCRYIESDKREMKKKESEREKGPKNTEWNEMKWKKMKIISQLRGQCIDSISKKKILLNRMKWVQRPFRQNVKWIKRAIVYQHFIFLFPALVFGLCSSFIVHHRHSTQCRLSSMISTNGPFLINEWGEQKKCTQNLNAFNRYWELKRCFHFHSMF